MISQNEYQDPHTDNYQQHSKQSFDHQPASTTNKVKDTNQTALAWVAMISMCVITGLLFCPFIPDSRIASLQDTLDVYYVAQASIVGIYMGARAFMARKNTPNNFN